MEIRRIRAVEGTALKDIRLRALADAPGAFGSSYTDSVRKPDTHWIEWARRAAVGDAECVFVADSGAELNGLIGAFTIQGRPTHKHLIATWVAPSHRRRGIGRELTRAVVGWCRTGGAARVGLWVVAGNGAARSLYEKEGFVMEGRSQPLPSNPDLTEDLMILNLKAKDVVSGSIEMCR